MAETIELKYDINNCSVRATPKTWSCKACKLFRQHIASLPNRLPDEIKRFDVCGVYLLLSRKSVYVGEAEQVIIRLKQHASNPQFDWNVALVFISKEQELEKSHIKYLENELYCRLKNAGNYVIENMTKPKRSHVNDEETMQTYCRNFIALTDILGFSDLFSKTNEPPTSPKKCSPKQQRHDDIHSFIERYKKLIETCNANYLDYFSKRKIKAQKIAKCALKYAMEKRFIPLNELLFLSNKQTAALFRGGGWPLLRLTNGDSQDYKDSFGYSRYCSMPPVSVDNKQFLISHELYNKAGNDSITPLVIFLLDHEISLDTIESLCSSEQ